VEATHLAGSQNAGMEELTASNSNAPAQSPVNISIFFRLSPELRNQVYKLVLTRPFCLPGPPQCTQLLPHLPQDKETQPASKSTALALLQVNRQIYLETRFLPFQLNKIILPKVRYPAFYFGGRQCYLRTYIQVLEGLQVWQRTEIRHLELHFNSDDLKTLRNNKVYWAWYWSAKLASGQHSQRGTSAYQSSKADRRHGYGADLDELGLWIAPRLTMLTSLKTFTIDETDIALSNNGGSQAG